MIYRPDKEIELVNRPFFIDRYGNKINEEDVLFIDIETVSQEKKLVDNSDQYRFLWSGKCDTLRKFSNEYTEDMSDEEIYDRGCGLFPEYGKIACVTLGMLKDSQFKMVSLIGDHIEEDQREKWIITNTYYLISKFKYQYICGNNIKRFDIQFLLKRGMHHQLNIPYNVFKYGQKPWEGCLIDITESFGQRGTLKDTRLETISFVFGIEGAKNTMKGADVNKFYYNGELKKIAEYCEEDVMQTYLQFNYLQNLKGV